ncbi:MAG: DsbE family thiol:disulfide interchange protein [Rhodobacter sp.]|nr:DsbE family thiol:disulfide interchange protein [Rhodobacter sp.]
MVKPLMLAPPLIFAGLAVLFFVGMQRSDPDQLPSAMEGRGAPAVQVAALGTGPALGDAMLREPGVKLVNFWASWCAPCRAEHPVLKALAAEGVTILGVNHKDKPEAALQFLEELGNPYAAIGADDSGRMGLDWGLYGVPETFVIDGTGKVILRHAGPITASILQERIRPALVAAAGG